jgi:hypothetical protein
MSKISTKLGALGLGVALVLGIVSSAATAQEVPEIPEPIPSTLQEVINTVASESTQAADQAGAAFEAAGFALRPVCATTGTAFVIVVIAGAAVPSPVNVVPLSGPVFVACAYSFGEGPADPVLQDVDSEVGPPVEQELGPVLDQVSAELAPVRGDLGEVCANASLFRGVSRYLPPPLHRFDYIGVVCG